MIFKNETITIDMSEVVSILKTNTHKIKIVYRSGNELEITSEITKKDRDFLYKLLQEAFCVDRGFSSEILIIAPKATEKEVKK